MPLKIEKRVPIPRPTRQSYPFESMEVGDSFFVENGSYNNVNSSAVHWARKRKGVKFLTRDVSGGVRCWRTE